MDVEDGRHFRNRGLNTEPPWDAATSTAIGKHVLEVADVCCREQPPRKPSVYTGEGGIALMLLKLALLPGFGERQALLQQAHDHVRRCHPHFKPTRFATFLEGKAGALCIEAAVRHLMGQPQEADRLCMQLLRLADDVMAMPLGECEVLYGRCGYLYSILFLRKVLNDENFGKTAAHSVIEQVVTAGGSGAVLSYTWHDKCYYGAAHGLCGILHVLLHFPSELASMPHSDRTFRQIRSTIDHLLSSRFRSGNVPSSQGSDRDKLVQWCHGAPGFVPLLIRAADALKAPQYLEDARALGDVVWTRGLLRNGVGLCHGISGNGYAHLALFRATGDPLYLRRAQHFAQFSMGALEELMDSPDHPYSMFQGLAGYVCYCADVLHPDVSWFPGYEL